MKRSGKGKGKRGDKSGDTSLGAAAAGTKEAAGFTAYLKCTDLGSNKFWRVAQLGSTTVVRYGRIGANGTTRTKEHATARAAKREARKLVKQKLGKGYQHADPAEVRTAAAKASAAGNGDAGVSPGASSPRAAPGAGAGAGASSGSRPAATSAGKRARDQPLRGVVLCLSGRCKASRAHLSKLISSRGGILLSRVTQQTTHLLLGARGEGTANHRAAVSAGLPIVDEAWLATRIEAGATPAAAAPAATAGGVGTGGSVEEAKAAAGSAGTGSGHTLTELGRAVGFRPRPDGYIRLLACQPDDGDDVQCYIADDRLPWATAKSLIRRRAKLSPADRRKLDRLQIGDAVQTTANPKRHNEVFVIVPPTESESGPMLVWSCNHQNDEELPLAISTLLVDAAAYYQSHPFQSIAVPRDHPTVVRRNGGRPLPSAFTPSLISGKVFARFQDPVEEYHSAYGRLMHPRSKFAYQANRGPLPPNATVLKLEHRRFFLDLGERDFGGNPHERGCRFDVQRRLGEWVTHDNWRYFYHVRAIGNGTVRVFVRSKAHRKEGMWEAFRQGLPDEAAARRYHAAASSGAATGAVAVSSSTPSARSTRSTRSTRVVAAAAAAGIDTGGGTAAGAGGAGVGADSTKSHADVGATAGAASEGAGGATTDAAYLRWIDGVPGDELVAEFTGVEGLWFGQAGGNFPTPTYAGHTVLLLLQGGRRLVSVGLEVVAADLEVGEVVEYFDGGDHHNDVFWSCVVTNRRILLMAHRGMQISRTDPALPAGACDVVDGATPAFEPYGDVLYASPPKYDVEMTDLPLQTLDSGSDRELAEYAEEGSDDGGEGEDDDDGSAAEAENEKVENSDDDDW